ncbi:MAG TPA: phosphate signaling complex protein PhoU [Phycisphaerae bacterium]|nr:phosphate signaling complex protein PhoU [Phycisphaerae bacterium]
MSVHMHREIDKLKKHILALGALVEENVQLSLKALSTGDKSLADRVLDRDEEIDRKEVAIEEECLKILALYQPVAVDLRFVVALLKINNDLERVGDQAVNIANKVEITARAGNASLLHVFESVMVDKALWMLRESLNALVNMDTGLARKVRATDDEVDNLKGEAREAFLREITKKPDHARTLLALFGAARNIERMADLACNIAEDVIYMVEGNIVRHGGNQADK